MAGYDIAELQRRRAERKRSDAGELVELVVAWGTHWDAEGEKIPGETVRVPEVDAQAFLRQGNLVTREKWEALAEAEAARAKLAALEGRESAPVGPAPLPAPKVPSDVGTGAALNVSRVPLDVQDVVPEETQEEAPEASGVATEAEVPGVATEAELPPELAPFQGGKRKKRE